MTCIQGVEEQWKAIGQASKRQRRTHWSTTARAGAFGLALIALTACASRPASPPHAATQAESASVETGVPLASGVPRSAVPRSAGAEPSAEQRLGCFEEPEPEWQLQSSWMQASAERLDAALPGLSHCTESLPDGEPIALSLRLLFDNRGAPISQLIGEVPERGCGVARCVAESLSKVWVAPQEDREQAAFDLSLLLQRGQAPQPLEPAGPLLQTHEGVASCVDRRMLRLTRERAEQVVSTAFDGFRDCHNQALERDHQAAGVVNFEFMVDRGGNVLRARAVRSTFYDCVAIECMLDHVRALSFPPPAAGTVRVLYPVHFEVEQAPVRLQ